MKAKTKLIGDIGVLTVIRKCIENNANVSIPYGDNCAYELIIYKDNKIYKVQVKTTEFVKNNSVMIFATNKTNPYKKTKFKYTKDEIDFIFVYCIENNYMGIIEVDKCAKQLSLRINKTLNNQNKNIKYATDYAFENVWDKL